MTKRASSTLDGKRYFNLTQIEVSLTIVTVLIITLKIKNGYISMSSNYESMPFKPEHIIVLTCYCSNLHMSPIT